MRLIELLGALLRAFPAHTRSCIGQSFNTSLLSKDILYPKFPDRLQYYDWDRFALGFDKHYCKPSIL